MMTMSSLDRAPNQAHPNRKLTDQQWDDLFAEAYAAGSPRTVEEICASHGVSRARFYAKRKARLKKEEAGVCSSDPS